MNAVLNALAALPVLDQILIVLMALVPLGWLLGVLASVWKALRYRRRMVGSPPWWAILTFGVCGLVMVLRQFLNGTVVHHHDPGRFLVFLVVSVLFVFYALRRGKAVGFQAFGEYGPAGAAFRDSEPVPVGRLFLFVAFWGLVAWAVFRLYPHAAGRNLLMLVLLVFAGGYPFARRISLLDWALASSEDRDRSRGNRFLFGGVLLLAISLVPHFVIQPNRWIYVAGGLLCLLIGVSYRKGSPALPRDDDALPVFQPLGSMAREGAEIPVRGVAAAGAAPEAAELTEVPDIPGDAWQLPPELEAADAAPGSRGLRWPLLVLGAAVLAFAAYQWQAYSANDGYGGIMVLVMGAFNAVVTLVGLIMFGAGFGSKAGGPGS